MESQAQPDPRALLAAESAWLHELARSLLRDPADAADVAQDVSVLALRRPPDVEGNRLRMRGWLGEAVRRLAQATRRRHAKRTSRERQAATPESFEQESAERLALHRKLLDAVRALDEPYRSTVVQCYLEGRPPREIAKRKRLPAATVRQHLSRALQQLRERLAREFGSEDEWRKALAPIAGTLVPAATIAETLVWSIGMNAKKFAAAAVLLVCLGGIGVYGSSLFGGQPAGEEIVPVQANERRAEERKPNNDAAKREVISAPVRTTPDVVVRVVDDRGRPIETGRVYAWPIGGGYRTDALDSDGVARFADLRGKGGYLVMSEGLQPVHQAIDELCGEHEVVLGRGLEFAGIVTIDGAVPKGDDEVRLRLKQINDDHSAIPKSLLDALTKEKRSPWGPSVRVGEGGRFRFRGVPVGWQGVLAWPRRFLLRSNAHNWPIDVGDRVRLDRVYPDCHLDLIKLPMIRGIVRWRDTKEAIAQASVHAYMRMEGGIHVPSTGASTDDAGRFSIVVLPGSMSRRVKFLDPTAKPRVRRLDLRISVREPKLRQQVVFDEEALASGEELVIWVTRPEEKWRHFVVLDDEGVPIEGAVLLGRKASPPTDTEGRSRILLRTNETKELVLGAKGYRFRRVRWKSEPGTTSNPWELRLEHGSSLLIQVEDSSGRVPPSLKIVVSYYENIFAGASDDRPTSLHESLAGLRRENVIGGWKKDGLHWRNYTLAATGTMEFVSLHPNRPFTVELRDRLNAVVARREIQSLNPRGTTRLPLRIGRQGVTLDILVRTRDGRGIPKAQVGVRGHKNGFGLTTDSTGRADFGPVFGKLESIGLEVRCRGYAPRVLKSLDRRDITIELARAVPFLVAVRDPRGRPVQARWVEAVPVVGGENERGTPQPDGTYTFHEMPAGEIDVTCVIGGEKIVRRTRSGGRRMEFRVPEVGSLRARCAISAANEPFGSITLEPIRGATKATQPVYFPLNRDGKQLAGDVRSLLAGRYNVALKRKNKTVPCGEVEIRANEVNEFVWPR